jgi:caffeoyl-CoA O-methyltransferase
MIDPLNEYAGCFSSPEPELLQELNRSTHLMTAYPRMLSGHVQGRILSMISHMIQPELILEIGTFTGYSALCLSEGLAPNGKMHTIESNPEFEELIMSWVRQAGMDDRIILHIGKAAALLPQLLQNFRFNLVFLDADKENYPLYYSILRKSLTSGSFIVADNVLWSGKVLKEITGGDKETLAIMEFNQMVKDDTGVENVILPVRDGISLIRIL